MNPFTFTRYTFGLEYKKFTPCTVYFFLIWLLSFAIAIAIAAAAAAEWFHLQRTRSSNTMA